MKKLDAIVKVETFIISIPRDVPYLGPLRAGEKAAGGYFVRAGNRTVYPDSDMSVLVKITGESGRVGWGETYGVAAPEAVTALIDRLLAPFLIGRDPSAPRVIHQDLYDMMRVRGCFGGYYLDALAGLDIAVWDLFGRCAGLSVSQLLGGRRHDRLPAYVSGLPEATLQARCDLAVRFVQKGFLAIKFAAAIADDVVREMAALREAVGPDIALMVDLHWRYTAGEAIRVIGKLAAYDLAFAEAPCAPEDLEGQAQVARAVAVPIALGEEWHTAFEYRPRLERRCMSIIQPEIAHTGISEFSQIGLLAHTFHLATMPHATIGCGIFMAASLQAASALQDVPYHEYQHSIFDRNRVTGDMTCVAGFYAVPSGEGIGVVPSDAVFKFLREK